MEVKAVAKHIRISPRKVRYVADLVRGKGVEEARAILKLTPNRGCTPVLKVLNSAVANAEHNNNMNGDDLFVKKIFVDEGVTWKRIKPRAMGRADRIFKRCSHITIVVDEREEA
ncbi:MAG: 50S ribosomal protein L22 [Bacillota bacterium]|jgi:large subunit ribosomal protein L22